MGNLLTPIKMYFFPIQGHEENRDIVMEDNNCSICLQELLDHTVTTVCDHQYHRICLGDWVNSTNIMKNTCPYCRKRIVAREADFLAEQQISWIGNKPILTN